jgi:hypothetical protein
LQELDFIATDANPIYIVLSQRVNVVNKSDVNGLRRVMCDAVSTHIGEVTSQSTFIEVGEISITSSLRIGMVSNDIRQYIRNANLTGRITSLDPTWHARSGF